MRRPRQKSIAQLRAEVICCNNDHPVGTPVVYHPVIGRPAGKETKTSSAAYVLGDHTAVVHVEGVAGCVALDACEPTDLAGGVRKTT